jgi:hypothetical protein
MHLVGYLYEDYHDARSLEHIVTFFVLFSSKRTNRPLYKYFQVVTDMCCIKEVEIDVQN